MSAEAWVVIGPNGNIVLDGGLSQTDLAAWGFVVLRYALKTRSMVSKRGYRVERVTILTESEQAEADRLLSAVVKCGAELPISLGMDIDNYLDGRKL